MPSASLIPTTGVSRRYQHHVTSDDSASASYTRISAHYGAAMIGTLERLDAEFPDQRRSRPGLRWNRPSGGFFMAMTVPFVANDHALARGAEDFGVLWTPMSYFYPG